MDENTNPNAEEQHAEHGNEPEAPQAIHTEREIELERLLASSRQECATLREENQRMFRRYSGAEGGDGTPKGSLDDWLLKMANNGGHVPADYPGGLAEKFEEVTA